jgi:hypothetical protein
MDRFDVQYNNDGLVINNNDVVYTQSDTQHVEDCINSASGWWKESFVNGVNIRAFLNSSGQELVLSRKIKVELQADLYTVTNPIVSFDTNGKLVINPNATI